MEAPKVEAWLRGPLEGVDPWLMPAAHALVQVGEEVARLCADASPEALAVPPGAAAPAVFHLRHLAGATDRLMTYARGEALDAGQRQALQKEKDLGPADPVVLAAEAARVIAAALAQIRATPREALLEPRAVGRSGLPSTTLGLIFHAAEHAQRHAGQLATTLRAIRG
jgi:uncharacterized damage-inducible protein DinB